MFVVLLTYIAPLEAVDRYLAEHREFLERHYAAGNFLLSGRKQPREGGVILATADSRDRLEAILGTDPFCIHGLASYEVVEFLPTMAAPALRVLVSD